MAEKSLKQIFEEYAVFGRPGKTSDITGKNFFKMIKEKGLLDKKLNQTEVDMIFTRAKAKGTMTITFAQFESALKMLAKSKYGSEDEVGKVRGVLQGGGGPSTAGTTASSKSNVVGRMTDTTKYTGSHKERFDESGKGKGKDGREYRVEDKGYVTGYKKDGTYDESH